MVGGGGGAGDPARRPGGDRLSRALRRSTMGAGAFHGRVRDGIGCGSPAMATGPPRRTPPPPRARRPRGGGRARASRDRSCVLVRACVRCAGVAASGWRPAGRGAPARPWSSSWSARRGSARRCARRAPPPWGRDAAAAAVAGRPGRSSFGRLGPLGSAHRCACTRGLSTCWSGTALMGRPRLEGGFPLRCLQRLSRPRLATRRCGWRHNRCTRGASVPVLSYWGRRLASLLHPRQIGTELSHDVLNPAHVPL